MFKKRYRVEYLAYANVPDMKFWTEFEEGFYTLRGAINRVKKTLLMRLKNEAETSKFRIVDTKAVAPPLKRVVVHIDVTRKEVK